MRGKIRLRCLLKDRRNYEVVRKLKRHGGELNYKKLRKILKMSGKEFSGVITTFHPYVIKEGKNVSLSDYDFVVVGDKSYECYLRKRLKQREKKK